MLDKLPHNLVDPEEQVRLKSLMDDKFVKEIDVSTQYNTPGKKKKPTFTSLGSPSAHAHTVTKNLYKLHNNEAVFDSYTQGFDLPASMQLNRIGKKLGRW